MFGAKFLKRKNKATSRVIEMNLNTEQFKQHMESYLYAATLLNDADDVVDITFTGSDLPTIPLKVYIKKGAV